MTPPTAALPIADCPFCGEKPALYQGTWEVGGRYSWILECVPCMFQLQYGKKKECIDAWNRRAPAVQATADADGTVKELAREIHHYLTYVQEPPCDQRFDLEEIIRRGIRKAVSPKAAAEGPRDIKRLVDRFLGWKLPENFTPDAGISFKKTFNDHFPIPMKHEPTGTNLFDASQAEAMLRYVLETPAAVSGDKQEKQRE